MVGFSNISAHVEDIFVIYLFVYFFKNKTHLTTIYSFQAGLGAVNIVALRWGQVSVRVKVRVRESLRDTNLQTAFLDVARWQKVSGLVTTELCTCFFFFFSGSSYDLHLLVLLSRIHKLRFISVPCTYVRNNAVFVLSTVKRHHYRNQQTKNSLHREIAHFAVSVVFHLK